MLWKCKIPSLGVFFYLFLKLIVFVSPLLILLSQFFFAISECPKFEDCYQVRVQATLGFALTIEDFDDLVDPRHLYGCCLGPEPFAFVLKKIIREEKSMLSLSSFFFLIEKLVLLSDLLLQKWLLGTTRTSMLV